MSKQEHIKAVGLVTEALGHDNFRVKLDNGVTIFSTISGKMWQKHIRVIPGDRVRVELSPYDLTRGRISYRFNNNQSFHKD